MLLSVIFVTLCIFAARAEDSESSENSSEQSSNENEQQRHKFVEALMDCSVKYQVPPSYFTLILSGDAPVYEDAKCFVKCGLMGLHYMNEDGSLNEEVVRSVVQQFFSEPSAQEEALSTWQSCEKQSQSEQYADDSCERAYNMFTCYSELMGKAHAEAEPLS